MSANQYFAAAKTAAHTIPEVLSEQGLAPLINRYVLTESPRGDVWLFVVMDDSILESLESYAANYVLSQMSAALLGHPVVFSNSYGVRYAVLLNRSRIPSQRAHAFQSADYSHSAR